MGHAKPLHATHDAVDRTIILVDKVHSDRCGTDQRRQRSEVANLNESQSEKDIYLFTEGAHSTKPRWSALSDIQIPNRTHTQIPLRSQPRSISERLSRSSTTPCRQELRKRLPAKMQQRCSKARGLRVSAVLSLQWAPVMPTQERAEAGCNAGIGSCNLVLARRMFRFLRTRLCRNV